MNFFQSSILRLRVAKIALATLGIFALFGPSVHVIVTDYTTPRYERAEAASAVIEVGGNLIQNALTAIRTFGNMILQQAANLMQWQANFKEFVLDPLLWIVAKTLIRQISRDLVDWINNGFQGGPGFVTDFDGFMQNVLDRSIGQFIEGTDLAFLCDPFSIQIRIALNINFRQSFRDEARCTLTDIIANIDNFLAGDFLAGGWDGWFSMTQNQQNNVYGAFALAKAEAEVRAARAAAAADTEINVGSGIISWKTCPAGSDEGPGGACFNSISGEPVNPQINTPGSLIEDQLATTFGSEIRTLEIADEFNEVLGALASLLVSRLFSSGTQGLRNTTLDTNFLTGLQRSQEELRAQNQQLLDQGFIGRESEIFNPAAGAALDEQLGTQGQVQDIQQQSQQAANPPGGGTNPGGGPPAVPPPPSGNLPDLPSAGGGSSPQGVPPPPPPPPPIGQPLAASCAFAVDDNTQTIVWTLTVTGGVTPYAILWTGSNSAGNPAPPEGATALQVTSQYPFIVETYSASATVNDSSGQAVVATCADVTITPPSSEGNAG